MTDSLEIATECLTLQRERLEALIRVVEYKKLSMGMLEEILGRYVDNSLVQVDFAIKDIKRMYPECDVVPWEIT